MHSIKPKPVSKMLIFDMDNTILYGRFIDTAAKQLGFFDKLAQIRVQTRDVRQRTHQIAALLAGVSLETILEIIADMQLVSDTKDVVSAFKDIGYVTGIISDSYDCVTEYVKELAGINFSLSNWLEFKDQTATGRVYIPEYFQNSAECLCEHEICKSHAMSYVARVYGISIKDVIAVGDSENDACMVKNAGTGVAFCSVDKLLLESADFQIEVKSFQELLKFARPVT
ncbi:MAG: HAD-IB family phosphatase [Firmicutes bacterium]|nr:HAD-IB family phosphatase [Bacillota bacterium]